MYALITAYFAVIMTWIYQTPDWPNFSWDSAALSSKLASVRHKQGRLLGRMESLGFELQNEASVEMLTENIVKSSAIEGEVLSAEEVRSSIAIKLGIDSDSTTAISRNVEGIVAVMMDATRNYHQPLTKERLCGWHAALFPTEWSGLRRIVVGNWRPESAGPMRVVSGSIDRERVHFEALSALQVEDEMRAFLNGFEKDADIDPFVRAAIAHLWFVTIHPFEDGNGRIARTIADMVLARADNTSNRFYSMSAQIEKERKTYYAQLEQQQRSTTDITHWIDWFLACLERAIDSAEGVLEAVFYKANFWKTANRQTLNKRQCLILNRLLDGFKGHMNTSKYAKIAKCSTDTALRDIRALVACGLLIQNASGGRSTSYRLPHSEALNRPDVQG